MKKIVITAMLIALSACTASRITSAWKAKDAGKTRYSSILVIAITKTPNAAIRSEMEKHLAGDLANAGLKAYSAYDEFGPKFFAGTDTAKAVEAIRNKGFDAVLTIVLLNKVQEREYIPGRVISSPYYIHHGRFWSYYTTMRMRIETEGYYTTHEKYFWESNLYDMAAKKLVYSVQTESFDPGNTTALAHEYGKLIVKDMLSRQVFDTARLR